MRIYVQIIQGWVKLGCILSNDLHNEQISPCRIQKRGKSNTVMFKKKKMFFFITFYS